MRVTLKHRDVGDLLARSPQALRGALFVVSENVRSDNTKRVPLRLGPLRNSAHAFVSSDDKGVVEWGGDARTARYAHAQHAGGNGKVRFASYTTPGTGPDWTGKTKAERAEAWRKMFATMYERGLHG